MAEEQDGETTFSLTKFIKRTFEHQANSTEELLNSGRGHKAPKKAAHFLQKEVGQNKKTKREAKDSSQEGSLKKEISFQTPGNTLWWVYGEAWNLRGQINWEEK